MFDIIFKPFSILFDSSKKLSNRISYFLLITMSVFLLNDYTGFIENYRISSRLEHIKTLKELGVQKPEFDLEIEALSERIMNRKNLVERLFSLYVPSKEKAEQQEVIITNEKESLINWRNFSAFF